MRAALLHQMWSVPDMTDRQFLDQVIADATLAEELGYEACWFGEHHFGSTRPLYGRVPVPELLVARLAAETERIRLGTGVKVLTLDTPARAAEVISLLDLLTSGRVIFGIGSGGGELEKQVRELSPAPDHFASADAKRALFQHHLVELAAYLRGDTGDDRSPVTPFPRPGLPASIWVGSRTPDSVAVAARCGFNLLLGQAELAPRQQPYSAAYRAAGGTGQVRGLRLVHVAETDEEAMANVADAAADYFGVMVASGRNGIDTSTPSSLAELLDRVGYLVGSPETVAGHIRRYADAVGADQVDALMHVPGVGPDAVRRSMVLYAEEVVPKLEAGGRDAAR